MQLVCNSKTSVTISLVAVAFVYWLHYVLVLQQKSEIFMSTLSHENRILHHQGRIQRFFLGGHCSFYKTITHFDKLTIDNNKLK